MTRRIAWLTFGLVVTSLLAACDARTPKFNPNGKDTLSTSNNPADIGGDLYKPAPYKEHPETQPAEQLLMTGQLGVVEKRDIPSQTDGVIFAICTEVEPNDKVDPKNLIRHPLDEKKVFRPLRDMERVRTNQLLMVLDDRKAYFTVEVQKNKWDQAKEQLGSAQKVSELSAEYYQKLKATGGSEFEVKKAMLDMQRAGYERNEKQVAVESARVEHSQAKVLLEQHYIRSPIDGVLVPSNRKGGEAVRANETIVQVQNLDRLRLEGLLDSGYKHLLHDQMPVLIEPAIEINEQAIHGHFLPVTAVAVANGPTPAPYFVSASEDRTARVWQGRKQVVMLPHPSGVRSVVCTPTGAKTNRCLTGADDGRLRLWDLSSKSNKPVLEFETTGERGFQHRGQITALAFSHDGAYAASADDQDICIWTVHDGKLKYRFPQVHRGAITTLAFTPQCRLISAGRDNTLRVWKLGTNGVAEEYRQEGRSGDVGVLGVSQDGEHVMCDFGQSLRVLSLKDRRVEGVLQPNEGSRFSTFALLSPDGGFVLTGTSVEGRHLSLYRAPSTANLRTAEVRQFRPDNRQALFTCAAFSPHSEAPFAVTGTKNGDLYVWQVPSNEDVKPLPAKISFIDHSTDSAGRQIRVWAEMDNPKNAAGEELLMPGKSATMVISVPQLHKANKRTFELKK